MFFVQVAQHHRVCQNLIQGLNAGPPHARVEGDRVLRQRPVRLDLWGALSQKGLCSFRYATHNLASLLRWSRSVIEFVSRASERVMLPRLTFAIERRSAEAKPLLTYLSSPSSTRAVLRDMVRRVGENRRAIVIAFVTP